MILRSLFQVYGPDIARNIASSVYWPIFTCKLDVQVCGGGPRLSLWHLRTMDVMASFHSVEDSGLHVTRLFQDKIIAAGTAPHLYQLSLLGNIIVVNTRLHLCNITPEPVLKHSS